MKRDEIRSLTGLRGVAALFVMAYHFEVVPRISAEGLPSIGPGYLMVDLFFVLSGFVMARSYGAAFRNGMSWPRYRSFLEARIARVYPLYALVCTTVFVLTKLHITKSASFPVRAFIADMTMLENLGAGWVGPGFAEYLDPPSWSISTEFGAYLLFPALALLTLHRSRRVALTVFVLCVGTVLWLGQMPHSWRHQSFNSDPLNISTGETLWPLARCLAEFSVGLLTYRASVALATTKRRWGGDILILTSLVAGWLVPEADVLIVGLFPILILQVCEDSTPLAKCLSSYVPYRFGEWSYAIYLLHWPALDLLRVIEPRLQHLGINHVHAVSLAVLAAIVIATSSAVHRIVEKPARRFLRSAFHLGFRSVRSEPSAP